ncbi:outer membrane receptor protein [Nostoc sp. PCC 7524]|uniref:TonB-dependent receptor domain-containing protein n=1 Tax=Nostoc sp. (strain ATCC 29411 / PCC 7524) TaxID=28072 RepID=UPI00029EC95E|nr:TonB-dependent receptor [Nostoc sp. PCC 7524]AFY49095.1 outer membrane receptor protein [Nostoc sp. PCC 7524]
MASQLQRLVLMTILALVFINLPGRAEDKQHEIEKPATSIKKLLSQAQIQITNVKLQTTDKGIEIILETNQGEKLKPINKSEGNIYVLEIPNAQLNQEFRQENPASGIRDVIVSNLDSNTIRLTVTGETELPKMELFDSDEGLIFGVEVVASSVPTSPQPETQQPQTEQPSAEVDDSIELVVTATRTEEAIANVPRSITVITREEIEKQSTVTNDLGDILGRTVPGLGPPNSLNRAGNAQTLRGRPVSILIDGIPQQGNSFVNTQLEYISPDAIERIEVVRGPTAVFGQGASGGVINIITRKPTEEGFTSTAQVGISAAAGGDAFLGENSFGNYLQYGFSGKDGIFDYVFSLSRNSVGGFFDANGDRIPSNNATSDDTVSTNILGKIGIDVGEQQRLQFTVNHGNNSREINFIGDPITRTIPGLQTTRALKQNQVYEGTNAPRITSTSVNLSYSNDAVFGSKLQAQAYYRSSEELGVGRDDRGRFADSINRFRSSEEAFGGRLQIQTPLAASVSLLWGADYEQQQEGDTLQEIFDPVAFDGSSSDRRILRKTREQVYYPAFDLSGLGLFAQLQWDASEQLILSGGVRHERFNFSVDEFTPLLDNNFDPYVGPSVAGGELDFSDTVFNVGVVYKVTPEVSFFTNFAQGYSVPQLFRVLNFLPPGFSIDRDVRFLQPQKIDNYEIGVRGTWNNVQATLAGFFNYSALGLSSRGQPDGTIQYIRAPQRNYGIEATLDWQATEKWRLGSSLTWTEGEDDQNEDGDFNALRTLEVQPLKLTAYVENQTTPGWRNRLQLLYVGNRDRGFEAGSDFVKIQDYLVVDYISSFQIGAGNLEVGIQNLLNNKYSSVFSQAGGGLDELLYNLERGRSISVNYRISW